MISLFIGRIMLRMTLFLFALIMGTMLLAGCGTMDGFTMENRVACSVSMDKAFVVSEYGGWIGISSALSERDLPWVCRK